jgi:hypothetical protein
LSTIIKRFGYNKDVDVLLATVTSDPPDLKIKVDNMSIELDKDDLIVSEHLTKHTRKVKMTSTSVVDSMTNVSSHTHDITSLIVEADLEYDDTLKTGDRVIVVEVVESQSYLILDRAVSY